MKTYNTIINNEVKEYLINIIRIRKIYVETINFIHTSKAITEDEIMIINTTLINFIDLTNANIEHIEKILGKKCTVKNYQVYTIIDGKKTQVRYEN